MAIDAPCTMRSTLSCTALTRACTAFVCSELSLYAKRAAKTTAEAVMRMHKTLCIVDTLIPELKQDEQDCRRLKTAGGWHESAVLHTEHSHMLTTSQSRNRKI